jgi:hypothetical protein
VVQRDVHVLGDDPQQLAVAVVGLPQALRLVQADGVPEELGPGAQDDEAEAQQVDEPHDDGVAAPPGDDEARLLVGAVTGPGADSG